MASEAPLAERYLGTGESKDLDRWRMVSNKELWRLSSCHDQIRKGKMKQKQLQIASQGTRIQVYCCCMTDSEYSNGQGAISTYVSLKPNVPLI